LRLFTILGSDKTIDETAVVPYQEAHGVYQRQIAMVKGAEQSMQQAV
jgi:hypothetical protein